MRVRIDRGGEAVRLEFAAAAETQRAEVAAGIVVASDASGRIVGIEVRGVDPAALHEFTVELAGLADRPAAAPGPAPAITPREPAAPPPPPPYAGPLTWEADAEAAILEVPFFSRGKLRLDASALARRRGSERVTVEIVRAAGRR